MFGTRRWLEVFFMPSLLYVYQRNLIPTDEASAEAVEKRNIYVLAGK
jgi:hypothetical protein